MTDSAAVDIENSVSLARGFSLSGQYDNAASVLGEMPEDLGFDSVETECSWQITRSYVCEFHGAWTESFVALRRVLVLSRTNDLLAWELEAHGRMAALFARRGDSRAALFHIESGDSIVRSSTAVDSDERVRWLLSKVTVLRFCNQMAKAEESVKQAIELSDGASCELVADTLLSAGEFYYRLSRLEAADSIYEKLSTVITEGNLSPRYLAELSYRQGLLTTKRSQISDGIDHFTTAMDIFEESFNSEGIGRCLLALGSVERLAGHNRRALEYYSECRSLRRDIGDTLGYAQVLGEIATVFRNRGELEMALDCYSQSLEIRQRAGDKYSEALVLNDLAMVCRYRGDYSSAFAYYRQSLETKRRTGDLYGQALTLNEYALALKDTGDYKEAMEVVEEGLSIADKIDSLPLLISLVNNKANIVYFFGDANKALFLLKENLKRIERSGCTAEKQVTYGALADIYRSLGQYDEAQKAAMVSADLAAEKNSKRGVAFSHLQLALISADRGAPFAAIDDFTACRQIRETLEDSRGLVEVLWREASVLESVGNVSAALVSYRRAFSIASACSFRRSHLIARLGLLALENSTVGLPQKIKDAESLLFEADELEYIDGLFWATWRLAHFYRKAGNSITSLKFLSAAAGHMDRGAWAGGRSSISTIIEDLAAELVKEVVSREDHFSQRLLDTTPSTEDSLCSSDECTKALVCISLPSPQVSSDELSALDTVRAYMALDREIVPRIISCGGVLVYQGWNLQFILFRSLELAESFVKGLDRKRGFKGACELCNSSSGCCSFGASRRSTDFTQTEKLALRNVLRKLRG